MRAQYTIGMLALSLLVISACRHVSFGERVQAVTADGKADVMVMDFSQPIHLDPLEPGWHHHKFLLHPPMRIEHAQKEGVPAIRLGTNNSASMLIRHTDISLADYPRLSWRWYVEQPVTTTLDETTEQGDDHPARLFLAFQTTEGKDRYMEIIWGNRLHTGEYKYIKGFPHYVARGGAEHANRWHEEEIDLLAIYKQFWPGAESARLVEVGLFCDTDDGGGKSMSYFSYVKMRTAL